MIPDPINQNIRELSYALIKVAAFIRRAELRIRIETIALEVAELVSRFAIDTFDRNLLLQTRQSIAAAIILVKIGHSLYEIETVNATALLKELESIDSAIRQSGNDGELPDIESILRQQKLKLFTPKDDIKNKPAPSNENLIKNSDQSGNRQSAILDYITSADSGIAESGFQLKDILQAFPNVSERTLRYDLKDLCDANQLERFGNGGAGSYYRLHKSVS